MPSANARLISMGEFLTSGYSIRGNKSGLQLYNSVASLWFSPDPEDLCHVTYGIRSIPTIRSNYIRAFQSQIYKLFIYKKTNSHIGLSSRIQAPTQLSHLRSQWLSLPWLKLYLPRPHRQLPLMVVLMAVVMEVQQPPHC